MRTILTEPAWRVILDPLVAAPEIPITAHTFRQRWGSASNPVLFDCDDGHAYVVKGGHAKRQVVNDQVVGILGAALGAPTCDVAKVFVPIGLVNGSTELQNFANAKPFRDGIWHGSRYIDGVSEHRGAAAHTNLPANRDRFARLAIVFGWALAGDQQFLYPTAPPELVYSHDHGHFFPSGPEWTMADLTKTGAAVPCPTLVGQCNLTPAELAAATAVLGAIDPVSTIARAVAAPLAEWDIAWDERAALAAYLLRRYYDLMGEP